MFANLNIRARFSDGGPPVGVRRLRRIATVESQRPGETFADAQSASLRSSAPWDLGSGNTTGLAAIRPPPDEVGNAPLPVTYRRASLASRSAYATTVRVGACLGSSFSPSLKERQLLKRNDPHNARIHFAAPNRKSQNGDRRKYNWK